MEEKTIYDLKLHEEMWMDEDEEIKVRRVASGWNYEYYVQGKSINSNDKLECVVFVPYDNMFKGSDKS